MEKNKPTYFYLMRHGQTLFNVQNRIQGWCDSPLTEKGIQDAKSVRDYFDRHGMNFDYYYCTTTERAADTLELATGQKDYNRIKGLKEFHFGSFEGQSESLHPKTKIVGDFGDHYVQFGGESQDQFCRRVVTTAREIVEAHRGSHILAVSHAGALMTFLHAVEPELVFEQVPPNCGILVFSYDDKGFHFQKMIDPVQDKEYLKI